MIIYCLWFCHCAFQRKVWFHFLYNPFRSWQTVIRFHSLYSLVLQDEQTNSLSLLLPITCSSTLAFLAARETLSWFSTSLLYREASLVCSYLSLLQGALLTQVCQHVLQDCHDYADREAQFMWFERIHVASWESFQCQLELSLYMHLKAIFTSLN